MPARGVASLGIIKSNACRGQAGNLNEVEPIEDSSEHKADVLSNKSSDSQCQPVSVMQDYRPTVAKFLRETQHPKNLDVIHPF